MVFEQLQRWNQVLDSYNAAARLDSSNFVYSLSVAGVYLQNELPEKALPILDQLHEAHAETEIVNYYLATCLGDLAERVPRARKGQQYWITSMEEISKMESLLRRAMALKHDDKEIQDDLQKTWEYVQECRQTKFSVPPFIFAFGLRARLSHFWRESGWVVGVGL